MSVFFFLNRPLQFLQHSTVHSQCGETQALFCTKETGQVPLTLATCSGLELSFLFLITGSLEVCEESGRGHHVGTRSVVFPQKKDCSETRSDDNICESDAPDDGRRCGAQPRPW